MHLKPFINDDHGNFEKFIKNDMKKMKNVFLTYCNYIRSQVIVPNDFRSFIMKKVTCNHN